MPDTASSPDGKRASLPRPCRRGFILLFGTKNIVSAGATKPLDARCPRCGVQGKLVGKSVRPWFTLFFIPIFPVGSSRQFTQCMNCNASFAMAPEQLASQVAQVDAKQNERAIAMYNSLRSSPANSITLNELMQMYASMNELDQAISTAAAFPQALNSSEQCMSTLGRLYLAKNQHTDAIQWFDAAIARNPALAEAHYYKAAAYMTGKPSNPTKAISSARAARNAGYPGAEELLREAEEKARGEEH